MYETLHPDVKGYIDIYENNHPHYHVKGWCYYDKDGGKVFAPFRLTDGETIVEIMPIDRPDVSLHFKNDAVQQCGWEGNINTSTNFEIQMQMNNRWWPIFSFKAVDTRFHAAPVIPSYIVIDNFYEQPDKVRDFALECNFAYHPANHKGCRTDICYRFPGLKERFEHVLNRKIRNWTYYGTNGCFQYCVKGDETVYHADTQQYAGVLYLTPDAPVDGGTALYRSRITKKMKYKPDEYHTVFRNGHLDETDFEMVDKIGNMYNRLILFDAQCIHAGINYFGNNKEDGRLFQLFFFDLE
jgi:hypothetical protein